MSCSRTVASDRAVDYGVEVIESEAEQRPDDGCRGWEIERNGSSRLQAVEARRWTSKSAASHRGGNNATKPR